MSVSITKNQASLLKTCYIDSTNINNLPWYNDKFDIPVFPMEKALGKYGRKGRKS